MRNLAVTQAVQLAAPVEYWAINMLVYETCSSVQLALHTEVTVNVLVMVFAI